MCSPRSILLINSPRNTSVQKAWHFFCTFRLSSAASSLLCSSPSEGSFFWGGSASVWGLSGDGSVGLFRMTSNAWPEARLFSDFTSISVKKTWWGHSNPNIPLVRPSNHWPFGYWRSYLQTDRRCWDEAGNTNMSRGETTPTSLSASQSRLQKNESTVNMITNQWCICMQWINQNLHWRKI